MQRIPFLASTLNSPQIRKKRSSLHRFSLGLLCIMGLALVAFGIVCSPVASARTSAKGAKDGTEQGNISLEGVVQAYDSTAGSLSLTTEDGKAFTLTVTDQTQIRADDGASTTIANGQKIEAVAQQNADGSYTALSIEIQADSDTAPARTFVGLFQQYDETNATLTLSTPDGKTLTFATTSQTTLKGANSLAAITKGTLVLVKAQPQSDGSYTALQVQVPDHDKGNKHGKGNSDNHGKGNKHGKGNGTTHGKHGGRTRR